MDFIKYSDYHYSVLFENEILNEVDFKNFCALVETEISEVYITAERNCISRDEIKSFLLKERLVTNLDYELNVNDILVTSTGNNNLDLLAFLWNAYEQFVCFFTCSKTIDRKKIVEVIRKRRTWDEMVQLLEGVVIYKGIEENVVWVGSSIDLNSLITKSVF